MRLLLLLRPSICIILHVSEPRHKAYHWYRRRDHRFGLGDHNHDLHRQKHSVSFLMFHQDCVYRINHSQVQRCFLAKLLLILSSYDSAWITASASVPSYRGVLGLDICKILGSMRYHERIIIKKACSVSYRISQLHCMVTDFDP